MVSRTHFLSEFDPHLVIYKGVYMGFKGIDKSLYPILAPRLLGEVIGELQGPTAIYTDGSKTEVLVGFGIFLDDRDSYRFRLSGR
jgi:hypothetical protein